MSAPRAKVLSYDVDVDLDGDGNVAAGDGPAQELPHGFSPKHFALSALLRCTLANLRYHADRDRWLDGTEVV